MLGHPIAHSLSPVLHRAAYQVGGLTGWSYGAFDVAEAGLAGFLAGLKPGEWAGLSLTRPLKQVALDLVDHVEPLAGAVGAVNTLLFSPGGLVGANTDVYGMVQAIMTGDAGPHPEALAKPGGTPSGEALHQIKFATATILGGGATAASALAAVGQLGVTQPVVWVRSLARSAELIKAAARMGVVPRFRVWPGGPAPATDAAVPTPVPTGHPAVAGSPSHPADRAAISQDPLIQFGSTVALPGQVTVPPSHPADRAAISQDPASNPTWHGTDLVISTLPAGAADSLAADLAGLDLTGRVLLDVAYSPWPSPLAQAWTAAGGLVASGLDMLLYQAAEQFRLMTGQPAPIEAMRTALASS